MKRLFIFLLLAISLSAVSADTCYVNTATGNDDWDGFSPTYEWSYRGIHGPKKTIQAGIDAVDSGGQVIVADGTYTGENNIELTLNDSITLVSENGHDNCVIDCQDLGRAIIVMNRVDETPVIIDGFTITNGYVDDSDGGAGVLFNNAENAIIRNCVINYCWSQYRGGAVSVQGYYYDDLLEINNCHIEQNIAPQAGGIFIKSGQVNITDSNITDNFAYNEYGGGIYIDDRYPILTMRNCTVFDNIAKYGGGGIYVEDAEALNFYNCNISNNSIYNERNDGGGGVYIFSESDANFIDCIISNNSGVGIGGGLCFCDSGNTNLIRCEITNNSCQQQGGGVFAYGWRYKFSIDSCLIKSNYTTDDEYCSGGGIYIEDIETSITNSVIEDNSSICGGAIKVSASYCTIENSIIRNNQASENGGGAFFGLGESVINNCTFSDNTSQQSGGGFYLNYGGNNIFSNCIFTNNTCQEQGGGAYIGSGDCNIVNCIFSGNFGDEYGGGGGMFIYDDRYIQNVTNCIIVGNIGSGIRTQMRGSNVYVKNSIIRQNLPYQIMGSCGGLGTNINYCNIEGGWSYNELDTNIDVVPVFIRPGFWLVPEDETDLSAYRWLDGDYHLKSTGGRYVPDSGSWALDDVSSLCIDAGDPNDDFATEGSHNGGRINMGAYGGTAFASKSGYCSAFPFGDLNGDCKTDFEDFAILASGWLECNREFEDECW